MTTRIFRVILSGTSRLERSTKSEALYESRYWAPININQAKFDDATAWTRMNKKDRRVVVVGDVEGDRLPIRSADGTLRANADLLGKRCPEVADDLLLC